ncbi:MAG: hypothetical protein HDS79_05285 [Bacteroidales bacterium]|nr:hypothetical protein [Bacteroidales bacterium]
MKYQDYFKQSDFAEVWKTLHGIYQEPEETRPLYQAVYQAVCEMGHDNLHSDNTIVVHISPLGNVFVEGAPDPQEWLIGREVEIELRYKDRKERDVNEMTGHLLYWSTLYGIKTRKMQEEGFSKWLEYSMRGPIYTLPDGDLDKIGQGVMVKYIFLDFDGVLNTEQYQAQLAIEGKPTKDEYGPLFDPKAVARLSEIVEATKAEVYIISSWGEVIGKKKILEMWEKRGLPGKVHAVFVPDEKCDSKAQWIKQRLDQMIFLPYVILDDEYQFLPEQEKYFIKINPVIGISNDDAECSIDILNRLDNMPDSAFNDTAYEEERERIDRINAESCDRKKLWYWKRTIIEDEAYDWSRNFTILRKKLEYNIGYYRFTQRYVGWEKDVERMELACRLMNIATGSDSIYGTDIYINTRNCSRFGKKSSEFEDDEEFLDVKKSDLRKEKAYQLVWTVLQQNMQRWWD